MTKPRHVDFVNNRDDRTCAILAQLGYANSFIKQKCNVTDGQITYRLRKIEVKRSDYRNGTSSVAEQVVRVARDISERELIKQLKKTT